jgi:hypothetical protein
MTTLTELRARVGELEEELEQESKSADEYADKYVDTFKQLAASQAENARLREDLAALSEKLNEFIKVEIAGEPK